MRRLLRSSAGGIADLALRLRPGAPWKTPWERSVIDDIAMRRPWNIVLKAVRLQALARSRWLRDGVTVVIVSWNTAPVLADVLEAVRRFSPRDTSILVIDNGSSDGTRELLKRDRGLHRVLLPRNAGHGVALDLGVYLARTKVTVTLDSDAVPLRRGWLDPAVEPLRSGQAVLAGLRARRGFVHPVYLAVDTKEFIRRRLSFQVHRPPLDPGVPTIWGETAWDTAELLAPRLPADQVVLLDPNPNAAPDLPGMTVADVVYHHGGVSRDSDGGVSPEALIEWRDACRALGVELTN